MTGQAGDSADTMASEKASRARVIAAWVILVGAIIAWPISALTWARDEPQFVLSLSWAAIVLQAAELLTSSQIHRDNSSDQ